MIRVFPRRTKWTPDDELAFVGEPPLSTFRPADRKTPVYVSCTFSWDIAEAMRLQTSWCRFYDDVQLGGPAFNDPGGEFVPGRFVKSGVTITSRGCPRNCPWCFVPSREGQIRELAIRPGWIVQDNNLLACSRRHIAAVFEMLAQQPHGIVFSGGLDARLLSGWHAHLLEQIKVSELWFACDTASAGSMAGLHRVSALCEGFSIEKRRCYVMIGYGGETLRDAEARLEEVYGLGFLPFAQLYRGESPLAPIVEEYAKWKALARKWSRPAAYRSKQCQAEKSQAAV